jgi:predicted amidohydrolase
MRTILLVAVSLCFLLVQVSARIRAIAMGNKVDLRFSDTYETWTAQWNERTDMADARGDPSTPSIIVAGELAGLTAALIGSRGKFARENATTIVGALALVAEQYAPQVAYYQKLYGGQDNFTAINAIELALTDTMFRAFFNSFSAMARKYNTYVVAGTMGPKIRISHDPKEIALFKDPDLDQVKEVYMAADKFVYNSAYTFNPKGEIIGVTDKYHLTSDDIGLMQFSSGSLTTNPIYQNIGGSEEANLCVAICYDSFFDDVISFYNDNNCTVLAQPTYNNGAWAAYYNNNPDSQSSSYWQPDEWLSSTFGSVAASYENIQYNINAMMVGNLYDMPGDGQSSITQKSDDQLTEECFVGLTLPLVPPYNYTGKVVGCLPWVMTDDDDDQSLSLEERRELLNKRAVEMLPGSGSVYENQYNDAVVAADLF